MPESLRLLFGSLFVAGLGAFIYSTCIEPSRYKLERLKITVSNGTAPESSAGISKLCPDISHEHRQVASKPPLKILHLSDLHLHYKETHKIEFIQKVTDEEYDFVVLTGDIFENLTGLVYATSLLSKRPALGAYAVLGNHDYYCYRMDHKTLGRVIRRFRHPEQKRDVAPLIRALEAGGFNVLRNACASHLEKSVHIVGIDYPTVNKDELNHLVSKAPAGSLVIVLFHLPVNLDNIAGSGADLALGGHTHGGQICIPGLGAIITDSELPRRQASGLVWRGKTAFHISRGLGADPRTNIRFFCPPAATVLEVHYDS